MKTEISKKKRPKMCAIDARKLISVKRKKVDDLYVS